MDGRVDLVAVGNALVDVVAVTDEEISPILGLHPNRSVHVDYNRLSDILVALPDPVASSGGGAANVAKITALLGLESAFMGRVGSRPDGGPDHFAELFREELERAGVRALLGSGPEPTGACAIIRMPGDLYSIAAAPSAALGLAAEDLDEGLIREARVLALDGFLLGRTELVRRALDLASWYGTTVALDVGSVEMAVDHAVAISDIAARYPLILFLNEAEAEAYACARGGNSSCPDRHDDEQADEEHFRSLRALTEAGPFPIVVVKRGARGAIVYASGDRFEARARLSVPYDVTGAGDAFEAGFLAAWIRGRDLRACAALANRVAREVLSVSGTRMDPDKLRALSRAIR